jgi:hypothetical protein
VKVLEPSAIKQIRKRMATKRGPYRSYKNKLSKSKKKSILVRYLELKAENNGKRSGEIKKLVGELGIPLQTIQGWAKRDQGEIRRGKHRKTGGGRRAALAHWFEAEQYEWLTGLREIGAPVTAQLFMEHVRAQAKESEMPVLKFSRGWLKGFQRRWKLSFRKPSEVKPDASLSLAVIDHIICNFWRNIVQQRKDFNIPLSRIINIDEVPVWFDALPQKVLDKIGVKRAFVKTNGRTRLRFTVVLAIRADGGKLPPLIIFAGEETGDIAGRDKLKQTYRGQLTFAQTPKAVMNSGIWKSYLQKLLPGKEQNLLTFDCFQGHGYNLNEREITDEFKQFYKDQNLKVTMIPENTTRYIPIVFQVVGSSDFAGFCNPLTRTSTSRSSLQFEKNGVVTCSRMCKTMSSTGRLFVLWLMFVDTLQNG